MLFIHNFPQLLCLAAVLFLTLPRNIAIVLSAIAMLFVFHTIAVWVTYFYLLGLAIYKGVHVYRKQSQVPDLASVVVTVVLTKLLWDAFSAFEVTGMNPLLISLTLVMLTPKVTSYFREHPINLSAVTNKRMLASLLVFAISFHLIDFTAQDSPFAEDDASVLLIWLLTISGILAYGLALNRIPALIVSAVFYLMGIVYLAELFALRPYLAELRHFNDVFNLFSPWLLIASVLNLVSLVCILVYTWGYKANPLPASVVLGRLGRLSTKVQQQSTSGLQSAKAFAQDHQLDSKFAQVSSQVKQHLEEANYPGQFQQHINRLKAAHQQDPKGVKLKVAVITGGALLLLWMLF